MSWKEEEVENPPAKAWLYDQALALIALSRDGDWVGGLARNASARAADALARFLALAQKPDGHWARGWNPRTGSELVDDGWVGDQAWAVMALVEHSARSGAITSRTATEAAADWLAARIGPDGSVVPSTEGTADVWWAMTTTGRHATAGRIAGHLSREVWDADLGYWWRGVDDPVVALDAATWLSELARHDAVGQRDRALAALGFAGRALRTASVDGVLCGLDGSGPIHVWNEGGAQYVAAGGEGLEPIVAGLLAQQRFDGSVPGSPADAINDYFGWWSPWSGVAPTAWLYFALTGTPFPRQLPSPALLLQNGRFMIEVSWRVASGATGLGQPVGLTSDTGFFWFFDPNNVELVVKALDGCGVNGRYWFFAGGLTDVFVDIRVSDTARGVTATYSNPQGHPFQPIQDTSSFATCP